MATKNCPKCESANPVACKKCACGHVFFASRRTANVAVEYIDDISDPSTPQEPEIPRRRTARVTRERPQFYDALQVENQTRRQRELQKRRKASKSEDIDASSEEVPDKVTAIASNKKQVEAPAVKAAEPPTKKRRGRPPGLTNRRTGRAQILSSKSIDPNAKSGEYSENLVDETEANGSMHDIPAVKALQMNLVLGDINFRIANSAFREDTIPLVIPPVIPPSVEKASSNEEKERPSSNSKIIMETDDTISGSVDEDAKNRTSDTTKSPNPIEDISDAENDDVDGSDETKHDVVEPGKKSDSAENIIEDNSSAENPVLPRDGKPDGTENKVETSIKVEVAEKSPEPKDVGTRDKIEAEKVNDVISTEKEETAPNADLVIKSEDTPENASTTDAEGEEEMNS